jgi:hypothetical protein
LEANVQLMNELYPDRVDDWRALRNRLNEPFRAAALTGLPLA